MIPGTYYVESPTEGFKNPYDQHDPNYDGPDPAAPDRSQGFITSVAARCLVFIEADNPSIGLMCFMAVGMAEVSTCEWTVKEGQRVRKGDELGMFHFGGSTHCMIFRPKTKVTFDAKVGDKIKVNSAVGTIGN